MSLAHLSLLAAAAAETALPNDGRLSYVGRFQHDGALSRSGWAGTQVVARFKGAHISANLSGSATADRYLPVIDGAPGKAFATGKSSGWETHMLAETLPNGEHTLALWKLTEDGKKSGSEGCGAFGGLSAEEFLAAPAPRARRLEFIGDSDTAGFCADGKAGWIVDTTESKYENVYESWAARIARAFDADMVEEAVSGIGVTTKASGYAMQPLLANVLPYSNELKWDFSLWVPDAVVMLIGPNDSSPNRQPFKDAYRDLMENVAQNYAGATVKPRLISVCGGSINGLNPCASIKAVNEEFNAARTDGFQGYYVSITTDHWNALNGPGSRTNGYKGCMGHYSPKGHEVLAGDVIPQIGQVMGWSTNAAEALV